MKKFLYYLSIVSLLFVGCKRELVETPTEPELTFSSVNVDLGSETEVEDPETRSLLTVSTAEHFYKAALFCFDHSTGNIILENGVPCVKTTTSTNFTWALPIGTAFDIYTVVNYGDMDLSSYMGNANLTETALANGLIFTCTKSSFLNLDESGKGIPMAGILSNKTLTSGSDPLTIKVKKLFARYDFWFDLSNYTNQGASFQCLGVSGIKSNTEVPFFQEGFQQTNASKLIELDSATESDLLTISNGGSSNYITIYLPENCQGTKSQTKSWQEWGTLGLSGSNDLALCTYVDFANLVQHGYNIDSEHLCRIYIGTNIGASQNNFDVVRNRKQAVGIVLADPEKASSDILLDVESAVFIPSSGTVEISCYTLGYTSASQINNLSETVNGLSFSVQNFVTDNTKPGYDHKASIRLTGSNLPMGKAFVLKVGNNSLKSSDSKNAVVLTSGMTFDGENRWYMPNVQSTDYMELVSTSSYTLTPSNFSSMEVCLVGNYYPNYVGYYGTGSGYVPCTTEFVSDSAGKYFIKVKARYSDIHSYYTGASNGYYVCRGTFNRIKARIRNSSNNWVYFDLGDATIHLGLAVVSRPVYTSTRTHINGWDDDIFFVPCVYSDKFTDNAHWSFNDNDLDPDQGYFYMPVGVTNIQEYHTTPNQVFLTQKFASSNIGAGWVNLQNAPYKNYLVSAYYCNGVSGTNAASGACHGPSLTFCSWGSIIGGDANDIRDSDWYSDLEDLCDRPSGTWRGNLSYKIGWRLYNRTNSTAVANGGYFDYDTPIHEGLTQQCWLRFHDSAVDLCAIDMDDLLQ